MWNLMVTGSRSWTDEATINKVLARLWQSAGCPEHATLIHGGCRGADLIAAHIVAGRDGWEVREYPARWTELGKRAGIVRNNEMLDSGPDHVVGFMHRGSTGAFHSLEQAQRRSIPHTIVLGTA
jgi:hypothetical protein